MIPINFHVEIWTRGIPIKKNHPSRWIIFKLVYLSFFNVFLCKIIYCVIKRRYLTQEHSHPHILCYLFFEIRVLIFLATCSHLNSLPTHMYYVICWQNGWSALQDYLGASNKTNHLRSHCPPVLVPVAPLLLPSSYNIKWCCVF